MMPLNLLLAALLGGAAAAPAADLIANVRGAAARGDFGAAQAELQAYRQQRGVTPEWLEAFSWLGRGALAAGSLDRAEEWAGETYRLATETLGGRALDAERRLPIALGAAIEVHAQVLARRGARAEAVAYLQEQLSRYGSTSIRTRIQKNINLLSLEGKPAPSLDLESWIGARPVALNTLRGRPVLLFFWAHWCGDCKGMVPALVRLKERFPELVLVAPTQHYGYVAGGAEAAPERETAYIREIWARFYAQLGAAPVPLSPENFRRYGASTTPTVVLVDPQGVVQLYHPGAMSYEDVAVRLAERPAQPPTR